MADRPILFSAPMVRALLDGRKTQTRRVINPKPFADGYYDGEIDCTPVPAHASNLSAFFRFGATAVGGGAVRTETWEPRCAVGDRLYVREAWRSWRWNDGLSPAAMPMSWGERPSEYISYIADANDVRMDGRFRQGMHMPRWASRLTLTVTEVRVQRLQEIGEADALAEGIHVQRLAEWAAQGVYVGEGNKPILMAADDPSVAYMANADADCSWHTARDAFSDLWDSLNADRGFGWDANPWVVAVSFTVDRRNIDQVAA